MASAHLVDYASQAMLLILILSLPPIVAAALVGTLVSLLQALTQIQEQTLSFAFKLVAVIVTLFFTATWLGEELFRFALRVFDHIGQL